MKNDDLCRVPKCRSLGGIIYYDLIVCDRHWVRHCDDTPFNLRELVPWKHMPAQNEGEYDPLATADL